MNPAQILAAALASGSPALHALVLGHVAAGRPGMAAVALCISREALAALDEAFAEAKDEASAMAFLAAAFAAQQEEGTMEQRASDELAALAAAEGFHLTPIFDPRLFCAFDSRVQDAKVLLDGREIERVNRAYIGSNGWVDVYPTDAYGDLIVKDDTFVIERHHGVVKIVRADGHVFE